MTKTTYQALKYLEIVGPAVRENPIGSCDPAVRPKTLDALVALRYARHTTGPWYEITAKGKARLASYTPKKPRRYRQFEVSYPVGYLRSLRNQTPAWLPVTLNTTDDHGRTLVSTPQVTLWVSTVTIIDNAIPVTLTATSDIILPDGQTLMVDLSSLRYGSSAIQPNP